MTLTYSFLFLVATGHLFGITLFFSSKFDQDNNWVIRYGINHEDWITKYICSLYWAFTTIITVGFGDILPVSNIQRIVIIVIEILGTSIFGYMINIIGMTLTELK